MDHHQTSHTHTARPDRCRFFSANAHDAAESRHPRDDRVQQSYMLMQIAAQCRAYFAEYARIALRHAPIPSVHRTNEPLQVGSSTRRRSLHARRAQNRRSAAPLPQMQALLATAATKWVPGIVLKGWSRCCWPPSSCSLLQPPFASKPAKCSNRRPR